MHFLSPGYFVPECPTLQADRGLLILKMLISVFKAVQILFVAWQRERGYCVTCFPRQRLDGRGPWEMETLVRKHPLFEGIRCRETRRRKLCDCKGRQPFSRGEFPVCISLSFPRVLWTQASCVCGSPGGVSLRLFQVCTSLKKETAILFLFALCFNTMA